MRVLLPTSTTNWGVLLAKLFSMTLVTLGVLVSFERLQSQALDETWTLQVAGRTVQARADGSFTIPNIPSEPQSALIQTNPNAPTLPHFTRLIGFRTVGQQLKYVYSPPLEIQPGATIEVTAEMLTFSDTLPVMVTALQLSSGQSELATPGDTTPLLLQATYSNGSQTDVTLATHSTVYQSSDPSIVSISSDGIVTALKSGAVYVSAIHEGMTASTTITVRQSAAARRLIGFVYGPTKQPIVDALVHLPGTKLVATANQQGRYEFPAVPADLINPKVRIISGFGDRRLGATSSLDTSFSIIDGGVLNGQTVGQILALPCLDPDQDCLPDAIEILLGLDPNDSDSNNNGILDGLEDHDGDLLVNRLEVFIGTNPGLADTDIDGISDGDEILKYHSIPSLGDSDGNGVLDGAQDQDNDGLLDIIEDANGNYLVDEGETDPLKPDTDQDGIVDAQELIDGTSPTNEYAYEPRSLSTFSFDTADYRGEQNQLPLQNIGSSLVTSFPPLGRNGFNAVTGNRLTYPVIEANNHPNINILRGTIKFWFKPQWSSGQVGHPFGSRLIEIGEFSSTGQGNDGWWGIFLNSDRTKLTFASQAPNSTIWERYVEAVDLNFQAGQWYEIELTYGPRLTYRYGNKDPNFEQRHANSFLFINGERESSGLGVNPALLPNDEAISRGFTIGSRRDGTLSASAVFDELKTYNYPRSIWTLRRLTNRNWQARADLASGSIFLEKRFPISPTPIIPVEIFRRVSGSSDWGQALVSDYSFPIFQDTNVSPGTAYEYRIWDTEALDFSGLNRVVLQQHVPAALNLPAVHERGKVIMMIENSINAPLASEIAHFQTNLVGDGWSVSSHFISRQNDDDLSLNNSSIEIIKSLINLEIETNQTNVVIMLGHVPVPMSGFAAADGHDNQPQNRPDHRGAWTADGYYGSTNSTFWTDIGPTSINNLDSPQNSNIPGDGKFDQDYLPQPFGIAVGRIDFARMTSFTNAPYIPGFPNHDSRSIEIELLRQYLNKNDRYRHGELTFQPRMSGFRGFGQNRDSATGLYNAKNLSASLYGTEEGSFINTRGFTARTSSGFGFYEMNSFNTGMGVGWEHLNASRSYSYRSEDFSNLDNESSIAFHLVYGSYFGDWNLKVDNWQKSLLGTPNSGLAAIYYFPNKWRLEKMGLGAPIAVGMQEFNDRSKYSNYSVIGDSPIFPFYHPILAPPRMLSILGDPTLRAHIIPSPESPSISTQGRIVTLNWSAPPLSGLQYHVYRSINGIDGPFSHMTALAPLNGTSFTDNLAPTGPKLYSIRASKLQVSGAGSYINLSQAVFIATE